MTGMLLSGCTNFFLIRWIADLLGVIMNLLYNLFEFVGITNIGLCIIVFTFIVKMLMMPLTIKQQKFTKLSSVMNPELQAVQKKYKGKNDQNSMLKMQEETKAIYAKYGVSQAGSCLQLVIQMPIIFALYAVISCLPNYVGDIHSFYVNNDSEDKGVINYVYDDAKDIYEMDDVYRTLIDYESNKDNDDFTYNYGGIKKYLSDYNVDNPDKANDDKSDMYDKIVSTNYSEKNWDMINDMYDQIIALVDDLKALPNDAWTSHINTETTDAKINLLKKYEEKTDADYDKLKARFTESKENIDDKSDEISDVYSFFGIDLSISPKTGMKTAWWALLIPILSAITQWLSMKLSSISNKSATQSDNPMASSMKVMSIVMPLVSAFFCYSLPAGLGLYWVITAVFQIFQQLAINAYFKKVDIQDLINANVEKANKKREKKGLPANTISSAASINAKSISSNASRVSSNKSSASSTSDTDDVKNDDEQKKSSGGSLSSKANMVKEFNARNNK